MPARACLRCGRLVASGSYCARCRPDGARFNAARGTRHDAKVFRARTLATTGGRCSRCASADRVQAHHPIPVGLAPGQTIGVALCWAYHRAAEKKLRASPRLFEHPPRAIPPLRFSRELLAD